MDALHAKLERELHKEIDALIYIKKFESKLKKRVLMKHGSTKVTPSPKDKAKRAWDVNSKNEQINISKKRIDTAVGLLTGKNYPPKQITASLQRNGFTDVEIKAVLARI